MIADSYTQLSDINVSGNVYIQVNKNASIDSGVSIQSDLLSLQAVEFSNRGSVTSANVAASVDNFNNAIDATVSTGNFATEVKNFNNSGTIIVDNLGFAIDGGFDNEGSITASIIPKLFSAETLKILLTFVIKNHLSQNLDCPQ